MQFIHLMKQAEQARVWRLESESPDQSFFDSEPDFSLYVLGEYITPGKLDGAYER